MTSNSALSIRDPVSVTMLGTGDAFSSGGRMTAGYLIEAGGRRILMEASPSILTALNRFAIAPADIDLVLISHLHGDHFGGLPFLLLEYRYYRRRRKPVVIVGPRNLKSRTVRLMNAVYPGFQWDRVDPMIRWKVLEPQSSVRAAGVRIGAIRSPHTPRDVSLSLKVSAGGRSIVFSGDTGWNEKLIDFSRGADLLLVECSFFDSGRRSTHLNYREVAANRERFKVGRLLLTHLGREVLKRPSEVEIEMAFDGMRVEL